MKKVSSWLSNASKQRLIIYSILGIILVKLSISVFNFSVAFMRQSEPPDAILVLGGSIYVERFAADVATRFANIPIIVSSGRARPCTYKCFVVDTDNDWGRVITDYKANDTLTNFTSSLGYLEEIDAKKVLVVTTDGHWVRARYLSFFIFGSRGIGFESYLLEQEGDQETLIKRILDSIRAVLWISFGDIIVNSSYHDEDYIFERQTQFRAECQGSIVSEIPEPRMRGLETVLSKEEQLLRAVQVSEFRLTKVLLATGADPNAIDAFGNSALDIAVKNNMLEIIDVLQRAGARGKAKITTPMQF